MKCARSAKANGPSLRTSCRRRREYVSRWFAPLDGERSSFGGGIAFRDLVPVHHVPPCLEVIGTPILIFQIVGVLPYVVAHQRALAVHERRVLIGLADERELAVLCDGDEHPARSEDARAGRVELVLELVEAAEVAIDGGLHIAFRLAAGAAHDLPEHRMIGVTSAIFASRRAHALRNP